MDRALLPAEVDRLIREACSFDVRAMKQGYAEEYYVLFDGAPEYVAAVLPLLAFTPRALVALVGEEGLVVKASAGRDHAVIKISPYEGGLLTTVTFYGYLQGSGVPVPAVHAFDTTRRRVPYDVLVMEMLHGEEAGQLPVGLRHQAGVLTARALRRVHAVEVPGCGYPLPSGGWSSPSWRDALARNYLQDGSTARKREVFTASEVTRIEALTVANPRLDVAVPRLIHGDPNPANALCLQPPEGVVLSGLIDPSVVIGGDPMFDLVAGSSGDDDFAAGFWMGYTQDRPLSPEERYRFDRLLLFSRYWTACWQFATGRDHTQSKAQVLALLHSLT